MALNITKKQRLGLLLIIIIGGGLGVWAIGDYTGLWAGAPSTPTTPTTKVTSTFTLIDYRTGEDVTPWVEISVYTPDEDELPFDVDDAQTLANFEEKESSKDAEDVAIDLRDHAVAWLEIDPDFESDYGGYDNGVLYGDGVVTQSRDFRKLIGGANYDYRVYVYHIPTNVSVAMLTRGVMDGTGLVGDGRPYNNSYVPLTGYLHGVDGTYQVTLEMPYQSTHGYHAGDLTGDEWDIDDEELTEITDDAAEHNYDIDTDLLWLQDQSNHRTIAPLYDLTDDANDAFNTYIEKVTNAFNIRITMNGSISETDGAVTQVNFTIMERDGLDIPADVIIHAEFIDIIFYQPITCYDESYNFDIRIEFGTDIYISTVTTNRIVTPGNRNNLGAVTLLNTMLLTNWS